MNTVDNRILQMTFDNDGFLEAIGPTIKSITSLNKTTDEFVEKVDGINSVGKAFEQSEIFATRAGFHIQDIWLKVANVLEYRVARKILDIGKKIVNALSFDGITDGFKEYELKMASVQTIMAGTGESLATVNKYLEELNTYSDKTIYSFADMTNNIGKFTNAGVKLGDAVAAIKGIANEAARSGANANEASRAMYNFSQALSAGYVKLIDWKSIENANMATKEFKQTLLDVAVTTKTVKKTSDGFYQVLTKNAQGKGMDDVISSVKNFNDSLSYQWMTTEVLTRALKIYATDVLSKDVTPAVREAYEAELKAWGMTDEQIKEFEELGHAATKAASEVKTFSMLIDTLREAIQSGWAQSWEILIGDFEEAKELWTSVSDVLGGYIDRMSKARNDLLKGWDEVGGRVVIIDAIRNAFNALLAILKPINMAMEKLFPEITVSTLWKLSKGLKDFTEKLIISDETADKVYYIFSGLFSVLDAGINIVKGIAKAFSPFGTILGALVKDVFNLASFFGMVFTNLNRILKENGSYEKFGQILFGIVTIPIRLILNNLDIIETVVSTIINLASLVHKVFSTVFNGIAELIVRAINGFKKVEVPAVSFGEVIKRVFEFINKIIDDIKDKLDDLGPIFDFIGRGIEALSGLVGKILKPIFDFLSGSSFGGNLTSTNVIDNFFNLLRMFLAGATMAKFAAAVATFTEVATAIKTAMSILFEIQWKILTDAMKDFATAIAILSGSLFVISIIDTNKLVSSVLTIGSVIAILTGAVILLQKTMSSFNPDNVVKKVTKLFGFTIGEKTSTLLPQTFSNMSAIAIALVGISTAVLELSFALAKVAKVAESGHLFESWLTVTALLAEMVGTVYLLGKYANVKLNGLFAMIEMAGAVYILVSAVSKVAKTIDQYGGATMIGSVAVVSGLLAELGVIEYFLTDLFHASGGGSALAACLGAVAMAGAVLLLIQSVKQVASAMEYFGSGTAWASFGMVSALLGELTIFMSVFAGLGTVTGGLGIAGVIASALGAVAVAGAVLLFVQSMKQVCGILEKFGGTAWASLGYLAVLLIELAAGLTLMAGTAPGAGALILAANGLLLLAGAMAAFSLVDNWWILLTLPVLLIEIASGLSLLILAIPGALALKIIAPALAELALAIVALGNIPWKTIGAFLAKFLASILALGAISAIASVFAAAMATVGGALTVLSAGLALAGPALIAFSTGVGALALALPLLVKALADSVEVIAELIINVTVALVEGFTKACEIISQKGPEIEDAIVVVISAMLVAIIKCTDKFIDAGLAIVKGFLKGLINGIPMLLDGIVVLIGVILKAIAEGLVKLNSYLLNSFTILFAGLAKLLVEEGPRIAKAFGLVLTGLLYVLLEFLVNLPIVSALIPKAIKEGIAKGESDVAEAAQALIDDAEEAMGKAAEKSGAASQEIIDKEKAVFEGSDAQEVLDAASDTGDGILNGLIGSDKLKELGLGLDNFSDAIKGAFSDKDMLDLANLFGDSLGSEFVDGLLSNLSEADKFKYEMEHNFNPVIDLTDRKLTEEERHIAIVALKAGQTIKYLDELGHAMEFTKGKYITYKEAVYDEDGEITDYVIKTKLVSAAMEEEAAATDDATESIKNHTKEEEEAVLKEATVFEYGSGVVKAFYDTYGHLYNAMSDDDAWNVAQLAIENFAISTYMASGKALETTKNTKKAKDYITEMMTEFTELKKKVVGTIESVFGGDTFFQKFEVKTEKTMEELLHAMHTNIEGVTNWSTKLAELGERGVEQGLLQQLAELGPKGFEYVNAFSNASQEQIEQANELFAEAGRLKQSESDRIVASYANAGLMATLGFRDGMLGEMVQAEAAANSLGITTLQELKDALGIASPSKETRQIGVYAVEGLRNGLDDRTAWAQVNGVIKMLCQSVIDQVAYFLKFEDFAAFGANIGEGLAQGIRSKEADVRLAALKLSQAAALATIKFNQIHSPSKLYHEYGENIAEGLAEGIEDGSDQAEEAAYNLADLVSSTFSGSNFFNDFDKRVDKTAEGLVNAMQSNVDAVKEWSDNLVKLGERGIEKGLLKQLAELGPRGYEYVHAFVNASDDELKRANELFLEAGKYTLNEIKDEAESVEEVVDETVNEVLQKTSVWDYARGAISAFAMQYWNMYKEIGETDSVYAGIYAIQTLAEKLYFTSYKAKEATGSYEENVVSIEDMINSFLKLKEEAMNTVSSVFSGDNFFKEFELKAEATADSLLAAMKSNVDAVTQWSKEIAELGAKGINEGLLKQLAELGPKSYEYVHAFADASEEQIEEANRLFEESLKLPDSVSDVIIASYANAGLMATEGFKKGLLDNIVEAERETAREFGYSFGDTFLETLEERFASDEYVEAGRYISEGFAEGIEEGNADVQQVVIAMSEAALETTEEINEINSPSKAYRRLGGYISEGFALGIGDGLDYVNEQALALSNAVRTAINMVNDIAMNMEDIQPVIKPVVDLSNVTEAARFIGGLNPTQSIAMASSIGIGKENYTADNNNVTAMAPASINVTQNNYSPKALDRYEIYRQTNNLVSQLKGAMA